MGVGYWEDTEEGQPAQTRRNRAATREPVTVKQQEDYYCNSEKQEGEESFF